MYIIKTYIVCFPDNYLRFTWPPHINHFLVLVVLTEMLTHFEKRIQYTVLTLNSYNKTTTKTYVETLLSGLTCFEGKRAETTILKSENNTTCPRTTKTHALRSASFFFRFIFRCFIFATLIWFDFVKIILKHL